MTTKLVQSSLSEDETVTCIIRNLEGLKVVYESDDYLVVNKDYDLLINSDNPHIKVTLQTQLENKYPELANPNLGHQFHFCHRLDYATSGLLCVAKHKHAAAAMSAAMSNRRVTKVYVALLRGSISQELIDVHGTIGEPPDPALAALRVCADEGLRQRQAHTRLLLLQTGHYNGAEASKVLLLAATGRRHQLRAHCSSLGYTIVGDYTYSNRQDTSPTRMMLHAYHFSVHLNGESLDITTEDPFSESSLASQWKPAVTWNELNKESLLKLIKKKS
ncbi:RNA pseudouridylate synthase domain-containing protein 1 isoform X2 [Hyalella azteca]|uniref:RNA pseudouridylate synthase domain-containing protein 1 isoform X2 n=1 Tax=Hyalella azteca TaxID=294128 RepID=A0A8B7NLA5_HYAAZ|nr:RNA pseudouridylate synthase domain-containing protein 1 isoform X2 [Hyalella azteca]